MFSRPICPEQGMPAELDDCIYRCFEAYRRQVLQRRAAGQTKSQQQYQQSFHSEQNQSLPSQPLLLPSHYSNVVQDLLQYQTSQQNTFKYSDIDQSTTLPVDTHYETQTVDMPVSYHEPKEVQYASQQITSSTNIIDKPQISAHFEKSQDIYVQPSKTIAYTNENIPYQSLRSQFYDSHVTNQQLTGSSIPTGTVEYTREESYSQTPILNQSNTDYSYLTETHASNNQQYVDHYFPPATEQTYNQNIYTNEQIVPQQPPLPSYEENQQNFLQQTTFNEPGLTPTVTTETHQQQDHMITYPPTRCCFATTPSPLPSDDGSNEDEQEDEEIFDLRACICRCYARFRDLWIKDQQERYQEQFRDIQQPILQTNIQQIQHPIPTFTQPSIPSSASPCSQQLLQQSNVLLSINCDHKEQPQQNFQYSEIHYTDASTQTQPCPLSVQHLHEQIPSTFDTIPSVPEPTPQIIPAVAQEQIVYNQVIPSRPQFEYPSYVPTPQQIPVQREQYHTQIVPSVIPVNLPPPIPIEIIQTPTIPVRETAQNISPIDTRTGLCLVPCPETVKHAHLPPHLRPELFCTELPPVISLPTPPPLPPPQPVIHQQVAAQAQRVCVQCCCVPGKSLIKKVVYKQVEDNNQRQEESYIDYGSVIDQMETRITVRYGNSIMEEGQAFDCGNYNEQLRIIDFPVYISDENDFNMTPLVPNN